MAGNFSDTIQQAVANLVSDMADKEIDIACDEFRKRMISRKPEIVHKIMDGLSFVAKENGLDGFTYQITLKR